MQLAIIASPPPAKGTPIPKKISPRVLESGVPASLRGKVWSWLMNGQMSVKKQGVYEKLVKGNKEDERVDRDCAR